MTPTFARAKSGGHRGVGEWVPERLEVPGAPGLGAVAGRDPRGRQPPTVTRN